MGTNSGNKSPLTLSFDLVGMIAKGRPKGVGMPLTCKFRGPVTMRSFGTMTPLES